VANVTFACCELERKETNLATENEVAVCFCLPVVGGGIIWVEELGVAWERFLHLGFS
jgi:hypothetical protein